MIISQAIPRNELIKSVIQSPLVNNNNDRIQ